ncbi:conjugated bile salt MFS transporter [Clostridium sp. CCUG 7971]|uniref:conjugated bile salt MFS transporter n=1 Tax=Clostridium sp. CCUG 7971 TaxID=2811414 RepID=UPI001ABB614B|nr:conjugated bile salt MFS transporter [Clostridium sp. CCUG 7971]MBO3443606.1 conjugated bile salt MFS transporter [Clostridium sp. CCUG 7971]
MTNINNNTKKFTTGWMIVAACMLIQAIPYGVLANLQPQFMHYVMADKTLGFTTASFSLIFTIGTIASAFASPFIGKLFDKFNLKTLYIAGAFLGCGSFAAYSLCNAPWQFYAVSIVMQFGAAIISAIGVPLLINAWFDGAGRGKALGIAMAGGSIGNIFMQATVVYVLETFGYKASYLAFGLTGLIVAIPITLFMLRLPKDESEVVKSKSKNTNNNNDNSSWGYTVKEALALKEFKLLGLAFLFVGIYVSALSVQYPKYLHQNPNVSVGLVGSVFAICSLTGNLLGGTLFDKICSTKTLIIAGLIVAGSDLALIFSIEMTPLAYVFALLKGLSIFAYMMGPALLTGSLFGNKEYAGILGMIQLIFGIGFAAGSYAFGVIVDALGYRVAWFIILGAIALAYSLLVTVSIKMHKLNKSKKDQAAA